MHQDVAAIWAKSVLWTRLVKLDMRTMGTFFQFILTKQNFFFLFNGLICTNYFFFNIRTPNLLTRLGFIMKTCLNNFDLLKPHFYIVKLGFTGVHIIFLISAQNIDCGYSLKPPRRGGSNEYPQSIF